MFAAKFNKTPAITLIGGGEASSALLQEALAHAPVLFAADGGADRALAAGYMPEGVIGDLDSLSEAARAEIPDDRILHISEQDSTDFDKALRTLPVDLVIAIGVMGRRMDHTLAAFSTLLHHRARACVLLGEHDVCLLVPPSITLELPVGTRLSLYPMRHCTATATGLKWPVEALGMSPDGQIGTSNETTEGLVSLSVDAPCLLLMVPRACLAQVISARRAVPGWSAVPGE